MCSLGSSGVNALQVGRGGVCAVWVVLTLSGAVSQAAGDVPKVVAGPRIVSVQQAETAMSAKATILRWDADEMRQARAQGSKIRIRQFPLSETSSVELELQPFHVIGKDTQFVIGHLDESDVPFPYDVSRISFFRGRVVGRPGSDVYLSLSDRSSTGYIDLGPGAPRHRISSKGGDGQPLARGLVSVFKASGSPSVPAGVPLCGVDGDKLQFRGEWIKSPLPRRTTSAAQTIAPVTVGLKQMELAVETDYELFTLFNDATATFDYVVQMYGEVSTIYMRDVDTRIQVVFVRVWDQADDLFNGPDPLFQFYPWWIANMGAVSRDTAQFFSGRRDFPFGGQAFVTRLCDTFGFGIVGYAAGSFPDPSVPNPFNWDIPVTAHELGHSSGTAHTHDNLIDTCDDPLTTPQRGPIMSYCGQTWSGMNANTDNYFHVVSQASMDAHIAASACIVADCNMNNTADSLDIGNGVSQDTNANGIPDECEDCNGNGTLDPADIAGASLDLNSNGIPDECEPDCNGNNVPDDRDISLGTSTDAFGNGIPDECETDCNSNGVSDYTEIQADMTLDKDRNAVLDACQDCDANGTSDLAALNGAHHIWVASGLPNEVIRQFLGSTGVLTDASVGGVSAVNAGQDLIVTPAGTILVSIGPESRVMEFSAEGVYLRDFVTVGAGGVTYPTGLVMSPTGQLLVSSRDTYSVQAYDGTTGAPLGAFVPSATGGLILPFGLTYGPNGNLFVTSDSNEVMEYDGITGDFIRVFVSASNNGGLSQPRGLAFKPDGNLLVASFGTDEVLEYERGTGAPRGKWAHVGTATRITQDSPWGIRIGPNGNVFVSRTGTDYSSSPTRADVSASHLTDARMFEYDVCTGDFRKTEIGGNDHGLKFATGFDFVPGFAIDCNVNEVPDSCDIAAGTSLDADANGVPDECQVDCNGNGVYDRLDIYPFGASLDCNCNFVPDECDLAAGSTDCNGNGILDECEINFDCNSNGTQDICEIASGTAGDCNHNQIIDTCEAVSSGVILDEDFEGGLPAGWSASGIFSVNGTCSGAGSCNGNGSSWAYAGSTATCTYGDGEHGGLVSPMIDLPPGTAELRYCSALITELDFDFADVVVNNVRVERLSGGTGVWESRVIDISEFAGQTIQIIFRLESDPGVSGTLGWLVDNVQIISGFVSGDCNGNGVPDACEPDCNNNGTPDDCDITAGVSEDCNGNGIPDECDIANGTSPDANGNGIPDECDTPPPGPLVDMSRVGDHGQRYLQIAASNSTGQEVIRVKPLSTPGFGKCSDTGAECIIANSSCPAGTCDGPGGAGVLYVGVPFVAPDPNSADLSNVFMAARLGCEPVSVDFGAFTSIAVYGAEVVPNDGADVARYVLQRANASCPNLETDETCWSSAITISQGHFADIVQPYFPDAPPQPNFGDITEYVNKFLGDPAAESKVAMQLQPNLVVPLNAMNYKDISHVVSSFLGISTYATAFTTTGLCTCPSSVTCGTTACVLDRDCVGDQLCLEGFCVDRCGRCSP